MDLKISEIEQTAAEIEEGKEKEYLIKTPEVVKDIDGLDVTLGVKETVTLSSLQAQKAEAEARVAVIQAKIDAINGQK